MSASLITTILFGKLPPPVAGRLVRFDVGHETVPDPVAARQEIIGFLTALGTPATAAKISTSLGLPRALVTEQLRYLIVSEIIALQGGQSKPRYMLQTYLKAAARAPYPPRLSTLSDS